MNILIFGGTTEGRILAERLCAEGHAVTVSCATALGCEELGGIPCQRLCGRLGVEEIEALVRKYELVVDATHPYAAEITQNVRAACADARVPLKRVLRARGECPECICVRTAEEAAACLEGTEGNILLTTGAKELACFCTVSPQRIFARVLPTHSGIDACERIGLPHRNILALQGPFTQELNEAIMRQYGIRWLVTKNSGAAGGFGEKAAAAEACGAKLILIEPPDDAGISVEELLKEERKA